MSRVITHGPHVMTGFVAGLPFSANIMFEHEGGRTHAGFLARDSHGRIHRRTDLAPGLSMTVITDPIAGKIYAVNSGDGTVSETSYPSEQQMWNWFSDGPPDAERRDVEGFVCFRLELSPHPPAAESGGVSGSAWLSPRIGLVAEEFVIAEGDRGSWRLHGISRNTVHLSTLDALGIVGATGG